MNATDHLNLKCGNLETIENAASFSRFVFPFAYRLEKTVQQPQNLFYQIKQDNESSHRRRKKYFLNETALILFERAEWFEIAESEWQRTPWETKTIKVTLKTGDFQIKMLPPTLVLFEFSHSQSSNKSNILQTGFLYVDVYFPQQTPTPKIDDLLLLNELFRYFDIPYTGHAAALTRHFKDIPIEYLSHNGGYKKVDSPDISNQAKYFERWLNLLKMPIQHNDEYYSLIPENWTDNAKKWIYRNEIQQSNNNEDNFLIHVDNRCYVWTAALMHEGGRSLDSAFNNPHSTNLQAEHYGHWIKLLNVDLPHNSDDSEVTHKDVSDFEKEWAKARTYKRWEHQGNWYGFNNHSGVMLAVSSQAFLCRVFREQYFDQTLLLLYLRATLFRFSRKLSLIVHEQQNENADKWLAQIRAVRKEFSHFAIMYQFPLLSNQQQAIEMYMLARECLEIDSLYREVQEKIANTHDFLEQAESNQLGTAANTLAEWGLPIATASLVASFFGVNSYTYSKSCTDDCPLSTMAIPIVIALVAAVAAKWLISIIKKNKY